MKWLLVLLLIIVLVHVVAGAPDEVIGRVVSVISGDSFGVEMETADPRVRNIDSIKLADIGAASTVTPEGKAARKFADSMLKNKTVFIDIDDNSAGGRNEWSQLICVIYLIDSEYRPVWPPVNRILVDFGYAVLKDDKTNEFNASTWWQKTAIPTSAEAKLKKGKNEVQNKALASVAEKNQTSSAISEKKQIPLTIIEQNRNSTSILEKDPNSGRISIGYRHT